MHICREVHGLCGRGEERGECMKEVLNVDSGNTDGPVFELQEGGRVGCIASWVCFCFSVVRLRLVSLRVSSGVVCAARRGLC